MGLPSYQALFLEEGLYREFDLDVNLAYVKKFFTEPDLNFDAHCVFCGKDSIFKIFIAPRVNALGLSPAQARGYQGQRIIDLEFRCLREPEHRYYFILQVQGQTISKIGQSPSLATIAGAGSERFRGILSKQYLDDLNRGIGLFAHGVGAGSFVYLRRIFEHLLMEAAQKARGHGDTLEGFEKLHMDEKVKVLSKYLPVEVVKGVDIYSVLSAGIHELSEKDCLAFFPVMRSAIEGILDGHLAEKKHEEDKRNQKNALEKAKSAVKVIKAKPENKGGRDMTTRKG